MHAAIDATLLSRVGGMATEYRVPVDALLLAAWQILLSRWAARDDTGVLLLRASGDLAAGIRCLVQTDLSFPCTFADVITRTHATVNQAVAPAKYWQPGSPHPQATFETVAVEQTPIPFVECGAELALTLRFSGASAIVQIDFRADLNDRRTVERMLGHYIRLLGLAIDAPDVPVAILPLVSDDEAALLLEQLNDTAYAYPDTLQVHELFEAHVRRAPDAIALVHDREQVSYAELNQQANQLACHLRALGIGPDAIVGICLERSTRMIVALMAVLKAGAAYLPIDPAFPRDRIAFVLEDASAALVLTQSALLEVLPKGATDTLCLDIAWDLIAQGDRRDLTPNGSPAQLAYVIYTSGSTGKPKGVMIPHRAAVNFLSSMQSVPGISTSDRLLAVTTLTFDPALLELMLPLVSGATVVLAGSAERGDPWRLCKMLDECGITMMSAAMTMWSQMVATGWKGCPGLRAISGGESLTRKLALDLLARCSEVWNQYGATETTVAATCWRVSQPERGIFIGTPIANTRCVILDRHLQLVPFGAYGELCIGGLGLARGYVNQEALTSSRFVDDPHTPGGRLYRTGDRIRWNPSGQLEFGGRFDHQVKLRGLRIELGEIEAELGACEGLRASAVVVREDRPGDQRLVAYVVGEVTDVGVLRERLALKLPTFMVPSNIIVLDALPLTPHGKLDRNALPPPQLRVAGPDPACAAVAPDLTPLQRALAVEWEGVLGVRPVGIDDDFFRLGGHSLLALSLLARVEARFGHRLTISSFLTAPTVRAQAELLRDGLCASTARSLVPIQVAGTRPPLFLASGWGGPILTLRALASELGSEQPLYLLDYLGPQANDDSTLTIESVASALIGEMRTLLPVGPYQLAGFSLGAKIVYEMARQLRAAGESIPVLVLLDHHAPGHPILPPFSVRTLLHLRQAIKRGPLRMWPYLLKYALRLRRFIVEIKPQLYKGVTDKRAARIVAELDRGAQVLYRASEQYHIKPYAGGLMVITAEDMSDFGIGAFDDDCTAGWRHWAADAKYAGSLPCTHTHMLDVEHVAKLARLLSECVEVGA